MISVPIRYRRSAKAIFIQKLQHAIPSVVVLGDGVEHLSHEPHGINLWLGIAEVGVSVLVIGSVIWGVRQLRRQTSAAQADHHHAHGVDWIDIFLGAMLGVEAYAKYHATAHIPRPTILLAVAMVAIGILHPTIARWGDSRRDLRIDDDGVSIPSGKLSRLTLRWPELAAIDIGDRYATITATDGRSQRLDLGDVFQPTAVRDALRHARAQLQTRHASGASIESNPSTT